MVLHNIINFTDTKTKEEIYTPLLDYEFIDSDFITKLETLTSPTKRRTSSFAVHTKTKKKLKSNKSMCF